MSSPVSANMTRNTPSAPRLASSEVELSGFSAVTMAACLPAQASAERMVARFIPDTEVCPGLRACLRPCRADDEVWTRTRT